MDRATSLRALWFQFVAADHRVDVRPDTGAIEPGDQVGDDLIPVGFVQHLMAAARIDLEVDLQAALTISLDEGRETREVMVDGILVADEDVDRQLASHSVRRLQPFAALAKLAERGLRRGIELNAAERVGEQLSTSALSRDSQS